MIWEANIWEANSYKKRRLQEAEHQSTLKARLRQPFQTRNLFRTRKPTFHSSTQQPQESDQDSDNSNEHSNLTYGHSNLANGVRTRESK